MLCDFSKQMKLILLIPLFILMALGAYITLVFSLLWNLMLFYLDIIMGNCDWQSVHYKTIFRGVLVTHNMMLFGHDQLHRFDNWFNPDDDLPSEGEGQDASSET